MKRSQFVIQTALLSATAFFSARAKADAGTLRVSMIPEVATTADSYRLKQPLVDMLSQATGWKIDLTIPVNYAAVVEAMGAGKLDLAYFGGLTYCQAHERYGARPLVQRTVDMSFRSLFITQADNKTVNALPDVAGKTFAYGDVNSTSGHLMPAYNLLQAHVDPDTGPSKVIYTGNHTATILAVASGKVDAGAVDENVYTTMLAGGKVAADSLRVFFTTPPFYDYCWAASASLDPVVAQKISQAFLSLDASRPADKAVLDLLRAQKYAVADDKNYAVLKSIARKLGLL